MLPYWVVVIWRLTPIHSLERLASASGTGCSACRSLQRQNHKHKPSRLQARDQRRGLFSCCPTAIPPTRGTATPRSGAAACWAFCSSRPLSGLSRITRHPKATKSIYSTCFHPRRRTKVSGRFAAASSASHPSLAIFLPQHLLSGHCVLTRPPRAPFGNHEQNLQPTVDSNKPKSRLA